MSFRQEFVTKYCNEHNGYIRWLRNIFYDEESKIEAIVDTLSKADSEIAHLRFDNEKMAETCRVQRNEIDKWVDELTHLRAIIGGLECKCNQMIDWKCQACRAKQAMGEK